MALTVIKGSKSAPKNARSTMETVIVTVDQVNGWRVPPFQRPVRVNAKVQAIAEEIKCDGTSISGILTLGRLTGDRGGDYIVDAAGMPEIIADLRIVYFDTMGEMADEFVRLNTAIVRMRPDDLMRGLTPTLPNLQRVMEECPYIGYGNVRRGDGAGPIVSIASALRAWFTSGFETPSSSSSGISINQIATSLDGDSAGKMIRFMDLAVAAWGRDPEYYRLWGSLNITLCMWLYRRVVLNTERRGTNRSVVLTESAFKQGLMALSADSNYLDWLPGRLLNDRDRSPGLARIKTIFSNRLSNTVTGKFNLPQPAWAASVRAGSRAVRG